MKVDLLAHMGDDLMVVNCARVSFNKVSTQLSEQDVKLIGYLARNGHWSPFAHPQIQFRIETSIFVARQLVKHQIGLTWNEVSRRYVDDTPTFEPIEGLRKRADKVKQGSAEELVKFSQVGLDAIHLHQKHSAQLYEGLLEMGVAPEQARLVLPLNTQTQWVWTGSLAAWIRVCKLRLDGHAQKETREVITQVSTHVQSLFPHSYAELMKV